MPFVFALLASFHFFPGPGLDQLIEPLFGKKEISSHRRLRLAAGNQTAKTFITVFTAPA
jgi:hypothetical protein